jgi:hypothetical protein
MQIGAAMNRSLTSIGMLWDDARTARHIKADAIVKAINITLTM